MDLTSITPGDIDALQSDDEDMTVKSDVNGVMNSKLSTHKLLKCIACLRGLIRRGGIATGSVKRNNRSGIKHAVRHKRTKMGIPKGEGAIKMTPDMFGNVLRMTQIKSFREGGV